MIKKPSLGLALGLFLTVIGHGCIRRPAVPESGPASFKVALLTPGPVSDAGWNASAFDGLQEIKRGLGAETALVQTTSPGDFEDAFRDFAGRGFDLVFAHGFEYTDAALKVGRDFPKVRFVVTSGSAASANVASLTFRIEEAAYVQGVIAGAMSKSGVVGAVGGIELPSIRLTFEGFERGVKSVRSGARVLVSYTGNFEDVGAAKEAALAQASQHADILFHNADAAGLGVFQAARERRLYAFGSNRNQNDIAPDVILASGVTDIPGAFLKIATQVKEGSFRPAMLEFGMKDGMVKVIYNPKLQHHIPREALDRARKAEEEIASGKLKMSAIEDLKRMTRH